MSEIITNAPDAFDRSVGFVPLMQRLGKVFRTITDIRLAKIGVTTGQDQLLDVMPPDGALSVSDIAKGLSVRPSTISKMLDRLTEKGLVRRSITRTDSRLTLVELTDAGRDKQIDVRRTWTELEKELASATTSAGVARMDVLIELEAHVAGRLARLR